MPKPSDLVLVGKFNDINGQMFELDYVRDGGTPTIAEVGTPTIVDPGDANFGAGCVQFDNVGGSEGVTYTGANVLDSLAAKGCIRFRVRPHYSGNPDSGDTQNWWVSMQGAADTDNLINIAHANTGEFGLIIYDSVSVAILSWSSVTWNPTADTWYWIEVNWDTTPGTGFGAKVFIEGALFGAPSGTGTRVGNTEFLALGNVLSTSDGEFDLDEVIVFDDVQHTEAYTPDTVEWSLAPSKPYITSGDKSVTPGDTDLVYGLSNIDTEVQYLILDDTSIGIDSVHDFTNNADGTATVQVDLQEDYHLYRLVVRAVGNPEASEPSDPYFLYSFAAVDTGRVSDLSIYPLRYTYSGVYDTMIDNIPAGDMYNINQQYTLPYSFNPIRFVLEVPTVPETVNIQTIRVGPSGPSAPTEQVLIVESTVTHVDLQLGHGKNIVQVTAASGGTYNLFVTSINAATIIEAHAKDQYENVTIGLEAQTRAIESPVSTRLAEPLISEEISSLLPSLDSLRTLATKLVVKGLLNQPGLQGGVRDFLAALTVGTPFIQPTENQMDRFEPWLHPLYNHQENFGGNDLHVWIPNKCVAAWLAFLRYLNNLAVFQIVSISEKEVLFYDDNDELQRHVFSFEEFECGLKYSLLYEGCLTGVTVEASMTTYKDFRICAAAYPFDMSFGPGHFMDPWPTLEDFDGSFGGGGFGLGPFGGGYPDPFDPGHDGWDGFSLLDRFDGQGVLDSAGPPPFHATHEPLLVANFRGPYDDLNGKELKLKVNTDDGTSEYTFTFSGTDPISATDAAATINTDSAASLMKLYAWEDSWGRLCVTVVEGGTGAWLQVRDSSAVPVFGWAPLYTEVTAVDDDTCVYEGYQVCPAKINKTVFELDVSPDAGEAAAGLPGGFGGGPLGGQGLGN
jgi:hypothetical protein